MDINLEELAREIAVRMAPEAQLAADDVGALLGCTARYVRERFTELEDFPKPIRFKLDHESYSQPREKRSELYDYIENHGQTEKQPRKRRGRPRNTIGRISFGRRPTNSLKAKGQLHCCTPTTKADYSPKCSKALCLLALRLL